MHLSWTKKLFVRDKAALFGLAESLGAIQAVPALTNNDRLVVAYFGTLVCYPLRC